ncbi:hypothetical protein LPTSP3_g23160 [Leptospira kobayashii]|uniref:Uncharacterized protein n=1 Tax=Leptospira kobayashii TaxID=1917830 RepID=A0ABM7UKH4_9LEPT|nr:hypothetical protein [Leptospira kobayashii]BDA79386.1 hypothetical protein LPTSP3_g23160 [Leptospira kobayashii]
MWVHLIIAVLAAYLAFPPVSGSEIQSGPSQLKINEQITYQLGNVPEGEIYRPSLDLTGFSDSSHNSQKAPNLHLNESSYSSRRKHSISSFFRPLSTIRLLT